jgi:hypothetical protein
LFCPVKRRVPRVASDFQAGILENASIPFGNIENQTKRFLLPVAESISHRFAEFEAKC